MNPIIRAWTLPRIAAMAALLSIAFAFVVGAFGSPALQHQVVENGIPCLFRSWTGILCPSCGMTHATVSLGQGDLPAAFASHPLAPIVLLVIGWVSWQLLRGRPVQLFGRRLSPLITLSGIALVWGANLASHALAPVL